MLLEFRGLLEIRKLDEQLSVEGSRVLQVSDMKLASGTIIGVPSSTKDE
jgi:hypothetical protein